MKADIYLWLNLPSCFLFSFSCCLVLQYFMFPAFFLFVVFWVASITVTPRPILFYFSHPCTQTSNGSLVAHHCLNCMRCNLPFPWVMCATASFPSVSTTLCIMSSGTQGNTLELQVSNEPHCRLM